MNISLRQLNEIDAERFVSWMSDESILALVTGATEGYTEGELKKCFTKMITSELDYHYAIILKDKTIGIASLCKDRYGGHKMQLLIGDREHWSKGYDIEVVKQLVEKAKEIENIKVYLEVKPESERSIAAFANCGFVATKTKRYPKDEHFPRAVKMELS